MQVYILNFKSIEIQIREELLTTIKGMVIADECYLLLYLLNYSFKPMVI